MNYKYKFTIDNHNTWILPLYPVKVIHLGLDKYDQKFKIKRIYIFIGEQDKVVKNILQSVSLNPQGFKPTTQNRNILKKTFGNEWRDIIGIGRFTGGDIFADDEPLDIDDEPVKKVKKEKKAKKESIIKYIYKYKVFLDDSIDTIKEKIEIESGIGKLYQHIFIQDTKRNKTMPFDYSVKYLNRLENFYDINILEIFKDPTTEKILDFPIDKRFQKMYRNDNLQVINHKYSLYYDIIYNNFPTSYSSNFEFTSNADPFTLYMVSAMDTLTTEMDLVQFENIRKRNIMDYNKLLYGFVLKYWPIISNQEMFNATIQKKQKYRISDINTLTNTFMLENKLKNYISTIDSKSVENTFRVSPAILIIHVSINNALFKYLNKDVIDLRVLYEYIKPNDFMIYVEYNKHTKKNLKYEHLLSDRHDEEEETQFTSYKKSDVVSKLIKFKLRYSFKIKDEYIDRGITITLNKDGILTVQTTWKQWHNATLNNFSRNVIPIVNRFIDKINKLGNMVLVGGYELVHMTDYNVTIKYMNTPIYYNLVNTPKDLDAVYIDPIKLPALMKLYSPYFAMDVDSFKLNEPQGNVIRSLDVKFHRITGYKELNQRVKNQMSINTKVLKTHSIRLKFNQQERYFKATLYGTRDISVLHHTFNFISRFLYLYKLHNQNMIQDPLIKKMLDVNENMYLIKHKKFIKYSIPYSKRIKKIKPSYQNIHEFINNRKRFNKVKLVKDVDPMLFNYDHIIKEKGGPVKKSKKIIPFSRLCQSNQQPIPMSNDGIKKLDMKIKNENILRYDNKTYPTQKTNYICIDKIYKYPGFLGQDYHPEGFCLPCCRKKKFMHNKESAAYKKFMECMNLKVVTTDDRVKYNKRLQQNKKYIKGYGKIGPDRYSWLPKSLMKIFNESWYVTSVLHKPTAKKISGYNTAYIHNAGAKPRKPIAHKKSKVVKVKTQTEFLSECKYKKIRLLDAKSSECILLYGIKQSNHSYVTAIESALKIPYGKLINHASKKLIKKPSVFESLEMGMIKNKYKNLKEYIKFIKNHENIVDDENFENIATLFNPIFPGQLNIIVFDDTSESTVTEKIILKSKNSPLNLLSMLENKQAKTIVIVKKKFNYYPFTRGESMVFDSNDNIVNIIKTMIKADVKAMSTMRINQDIKLNKLIYIFKTNKELQKKYKIISQYVIINTDNINICIGVCVESKTTRKKLIMPVDLSPSSNLPIIKTYAYGDFYTVFVFLMDLYSELHKVNNLKHISIIVSRDAHIMGFLLPSKREIYIKPLVINKRSKNLFRSLKKYGSKYAQKGLNDLTLLRTLFKSIVYINIDISKVNTVIKSNIQKIDSALIEHSDIQYNNELHKVLVLELNNKLYNERNKEIRRTIMKEIKDNAPIKTYKSIISILSNIFNQVSEINTADRKKLEQILNIMYYNYNFDTSYAKLNKAEVIKKSMSQATHLLKTITFNFDLVTIRKIRMLLEKFNKNQFLKEVDKKQTVIELNNIIKELLDDMIHISKVPIKHESVKPSNKIIDLCTDKNNKDKCKQPQLSNRQQCYWGKNDGCMIVMNRHDYNYHYVRLTNEILYNETKQSDILDIKLDNVMY